MFSRTLRLAVLAVAVSALSIPSNAGVRFGGVSIGVGYGYGYTPFCCYGPFTYDGLYGPYAPFWGPFGPFYPAGFFGQPGPDKGTVKLIKADRNAAVYIDNAYAGKVSELKTISIKPGAYDLELRPPGGKAVQKRIYVLSGKTLKLEF